METSLCCPTCGKPVPADALQGLCPECLLRAGFATGSKPTAKVAPFDPPPPAALAPLFPQLEIIALIGRGGMGAVYRARQPKLDRTVALKILPPQAGREAGFAERFTREARALARLSHPNIVAVHEFGAAGDYHYFVMEFVDGVNLRHLLTHARPTSREALAIVPQICDALQFAHDRGIVHRDIKPENILVDKNGTVKIADFGLAKLVGADLADFSITGANEVMGTPHYMAPEQVERPLAVDHRADIYSLGVVFYQLLTGELPLGRFAPPSRKVQIDVRLDEVVLRALEKEPEQRYQQASGLKTEVETIAGAVEPSRVARNGSLTRENDSETPAGRASHEPRRRGWILVAVWMLAGALLWVQARLVDQYLNDAGRLGRRGAADVATPLRQIFPAFAADAQIWVRHALALTEGNTLQLRHTDIDNAPQGREVHWNSAWAWCIAGAGKLHQVFNGLPLPRATERATLWLNPLVMLACILALSASAARRAGVLAGVVVAVAMLGHDRVYEGFFPSYVDHHGLATVAVFGLVLGAVFMGGGWWQPTRAGLSFLPRSPSAVQRAATWSAVAGACGMWISAASTLPVIAIVGAAGLMAVLICGPRATQQGMVFDAGGWRRWGRVGALLSFGFYLLEYFPGHLGFRLEVNHPLLALAWLGGGEFIAQLGERWLAPREKRWQQLGALLWPVLALAVAVTIVVGGKAVFSVMDPFLATLHRDYISEFQPLARTVRGMDAATVVRMGLVDGMPLLAAIATLAYRRREAPISLWFATLVAAALVGLAFAQARWLLNVSGASIALTLVLIWHWTAAARERAQWIVALASVAVLFAPSTVHRYMSAAHDVAQRRVSPHDAANALSRDIAAALRASQPQGEIVLLASPNASTTIGYYGRFKTLGTLYWENSDGLKTAAEILGARSDAEAETLARARHVTHVALVSDENFIGPYYRLLHPGATDAEIEQCFGVRLLRGRPVPAWLEAIPYQVPEDLRALPTTVQLFKVKLE
jgi:tRNA A-37 threonylcarbamoyl transferase component Bud32